MGLQWVIVTCHGMLESPIPTSLAEVANYFARTCLTRKMTKRLATKLNAVPAKTPRLARPALAARTPGGDWFTVLTTEVPEAFAGRALIAPTRYDKSATANRRDGDAPHGTCARIEAGLTLADCAFAYAVVD